MITGLLDHLQQHNPGSTLYGIQGGPKGIMEGLYKTLGPEEVAPFRNQVGIGFLTDSRLKLQLLLSRWAKDIAPLQHQMPISLKRQTPSSSWLASSLDRRCMVFLS